MTGAVAAQSITVMLWGMPIAFANEESRTCPCGCGQVFPVPTGNLDYGDNAYAIFQVARLTHGDTSPHVWLMLRTGPAMAGEARDETMTLHLWVDENEVITRIEDPEKSPFWPSRSETVRYLSRDEVLRRSGAKEWAIERRLDFEREHLATAEFLERG